MLLRCSGPVVPCCCVAGAASGPALRKGLDRRLGRALGARLPVTQGSAFAREGSKDAAFVSGSRHQRSIVRGSARERRILRPAGATARRVGRDSPSAWDGPREGRITAPTGSFSSPRFFLREARSTRRKNRARIPHRWRIVAAPRELVRPRRPAPVEALSENDPPRGHSNAAAREDPPTAVQQVTAHRQRRSSERRPTPGRRSRRAAPPSSKRRAGRRHLASPPTRRRTRARHRDGGGPCVVAGTQSEALLSSSPSSERRRRGEPSFWFCAGAGVFSLAASWSSWLWK